MGEDCCKPPQAQSSSKARFFLLLFIVPAILGAVASLPAVPSAIAGGTLIALLGALYVVPKRAHYATIGILLILAPTLASWAALPVRVNNQVLGRKSKLRSGVQHLMQEYSGLGSWYEYVRMASLYRPAHVVLHKVSREDVLMTSVELTADSPLIDEWVTSASKAQLLMIRTRRNVRGKVVLVDMPVLVDALQPQADEDIAQQAYPAWHDDYDPPIEQMEDKDGKRIDIDTLWFTGALVEFDVDAFATAEKKTAKRHQHVRPVALVATAGVGEPIEDWPYGTLLLLTSPLTALIATIIAAIYDVPAQTATKKRKSKKKRSVKAAIAAAKKNKEE